MKTHVFHKYFLQQDLFTDLNYGLENIDGKKYHINRKESPSLTRIYFCLFCSGNYIRFPNGRNQIEKYGNHYEDLKPVTCCNIPAASSASIVSKVMQIQRLKMY